jgi:hypothetical protein
MVRSLTAALLSLMALGQPLCASAEPTAQSPAQASAEQAIRARYRCRGRFDAVDVTALFFNRVPAELVLLVGETATRLPQLRAASGARYGGADQEFWIKGDRAVWSLGRAPAMACEAQAGAGGPARPAAA